MAGKAFVDTNVLLRALMIDMDQHQPADVLLKQMWRDDVELWISGQVIREFVVQATHPRTLHQPLETADVIAEVAKIGTLFAIADETALVRAQLLELIQAYPTRGKQIHDANIVATMLAYDITTLLTLNVADFQRYEERISLISP